MSYAPHSPKIQSHNHPCGSQRLFPEEVKPLPTPAKLELLEVVRQTGALPDLLPAVEPLDEGIKKAIAFLLAKGHTIQQLGVATGLSEDLVRYHINQPDIKLLVRETIENEKDFDPKMLFRSFLVPAIQALGSIVMNDQAPIAQRSAAAQFIINRNFGPDPVEGSDGKKSFKDPVEEFNYLQRQLNKKS